MTDDIAHYYDELHRWTEKDKSFQAWSGFENDTIHRFLIDPSTGKFSPETIYDFMKPYMPLQGEARGLDAGCGYGGTCFYCVGRFGGRWTGVTISPEQVRHANGIARARELDGVVDFHLLSYDAPLPGRYNVVVAIESLIHSSDPAATLRNLASSLDPGGRLIIADDMPAGAITAADEEYLAAFRTAWRCPVAPGAAAWKEMARDTGLQLVAEVDLSHLQKPRPEADLDAAFADLSSQRDHKSQTGFARLSDAEIGGLHLERLHGRGAVRYVLLVFGK